MPSVVSTRTDVVLGARPPLVITTCSARKRVAPHVLSADLPHGLQEAVASAWRRALESATPDRPAGELYMGRAIATALRAAGHLGADVVMASAGLGLVRAETPIPSYELAFSNGAIRGQVEGFFDAQAWWNDVTHGPFSADPAAELRDRPLVLACLSHAYAPAIAGMLAPIPSERLRIFGRSLDDVLPPALAANVLPYDDRLETAGPPGTRSDFAQRALLHFATAVAPSSDGSLAGDKNAVIAALAGAPQPRAIPKRAPKTDDELRALIVRLLPVVGKRSSAMLRHVRDREGVACEQRRFATLFREVVGGT